MSADPLIASIRVSTISRDLHGRVWNPAIKWTTKHSVFVEIGLQDGRVGLGECWCFDNAPDALIAFLRTEVLPPIIGVSPDDAMALIDSQWRRATLTARHGILASAHSGIDLALWDLKAQASGLPLWQVFNSAGSGDCLVYASGGLYAAGKDQHDLADEVEGFAVRGFQAVKMKVGGMSTSEDAARVFAVRDRIGPDAGLMIDGVSSYDRASALAFFNLIRSADVMAFQAPIPPEDLAGLRHLRQAGVPVMVGEAECREEVLEALIRGGGASILQVAPIACGGPSRVIALAEACSQAGVALSLETSSTAVATLAALHLGAALPAITHVEIHQIHDVLFAEAGMPDTVPATGRMAAPERSGLGFALPPGGTKTAFQLSSKNGPGQCRAHPKTIAI